MMLCADISDQTGGFFTSFASDDEGEVQEDYYKTVLIVSVLVL